jgi:hypothetical protein
VRRHLGRAFAVGAAVLTSVFGVTSPAHALADAGVALAQGGSVPWPLTYECTIAAGATTNTSEITWVVKASAEAEGPGLGTGVSCTVYDEAGNPQGGCSQGLIGPASACVGTAGVPVGEIPVVCVEASAFYLDGSVAQSQPPCP